MKAEDTARGEGFKKDLSSVTYGQSDFSPQIIRLAN